MRIELTGKTKATIAAIDIQSLKMGQTDVVPAVCLHLKLTMANNSLSMLSKHLLHFLFQRNTMAATQQALDIVDRLIERYSMAGEVVYDPFHGLGTVGVRAIKKGRLAAGSELNAAYFKDQVHYLQAAEREFSMPTLFDLDEPEEMRAAA